ncbi:hypothetical protein J7E62_31090 [Variovorax paradoxus]|nr:hypothetical protein [Variovorax paradoxus]
MAKTKTQLEAECRRLHREVTEAARRAESLLAENLDLRWQLGVDRESPDATFDPPGHIGAPGWVQDYRDRLKAELASKSKRRTTHA